MAPRRCGWIGVVCCSGSARPRSPAPGSAGSASSPPVSPASTMRWRRTSAISASAAAAWARGSTSWRARSRVPSPIHRARPNATTRRPVACPAWSAWRRPPQARSRTCRACMTARSNPRSLARIGAAQVQVLVAGSSKVKSISELKGKTIGFGPKLRDSAVTGAMVLAAYGITAKRAKFTYDEMQPTIAALVDGEIDAMIVADGVPNPDVAALRYSADARLLPVDGEPMAKLVGERSYLKVVTLPGDTYKGLPPITTIEVPILWTVSD